MYICLALCKVGRSQHIVLGLKYISWALCRMGRSQMIELDPLVYILGPMSGGNYPEYSTWVLCRYARPYVWWACPRV